MRTISTLMGISAILALLVIGSTPAQSGTRIHYSKLYNPNTVEMVKGEVVSLKKTISGNGRTYCQTLTLKTEKGRLWVILKPENFTPPTNLSLHPRDQLEITGSRVALPGKTALIAARVKKGSDTMVLRDLSGRPAWAVGDDWHTR